MEERVPPVEAESDCINPSCGSRSASVLLHVSAVEQTLGTPQGHSSLPAISKQLGPPQAWAAGVRQQGHIPISYK